METYGSPSFEMGAADEAMVLSAATSPLTAQQARAAKAELKKMRRALEGWLRYRAINDRAAAGQARTALLKRPGAKAPPPPVIALRLRRERAAYEQGLANDLHALLAEVFGGEALPSPDVKKDPQAAVKLAMIAVSGKLPGESASPAAAGIFPAAGFIWLWPLALVLGAVAFVLSSKIRNDAETAQERERLQCIRDGHCTDSGFWLKVGAVGFLGWLAWDRMGLGQRVTGAFRRGGRRR